MAFLAKPVVVSIAINARPDRVWAVVADLEQQPLWMTDALEVRVTTGKPHGPGTRAIVPTRIVGITLEDAIEVTAWEPPNLLAVRHTGKFFSGDARISIEPAGAGSQVVWEEDLRPPLGIAGRVALWFGRPILRRQFTADLARLKALAEAR